MTVDEARTETPPEYRGASAAKSSTNGGIMMMMLTAEMVWYGMVRVGVGVRVQ